MKKIIFVLLIVCMFAFSFANAKIYDTRTPVRVDNNLPFSDLQDPAMEKDGTTRKQDPQTRENLFYYNPCINEIIKATKITVDKDNNKLIQGYADGTFRPKDNVTKAEFIKMAICLATNRNFDFSIIPHSHIKHWAGQYVAVAEMQGVVEKGEYNDYNLNDEITRLEMIMILSKIQINMKGIDQYREGNLPEYEDISALTDEQKGYLLHAVRYELLPNMYSSKEVKPYSYLTREEAARAIIRVY